MTVLGGEQREVEALGGAEGEHDSLVVLVCGRKVLQLILRVAGLNCGHVGV